MIDGLTAVFEKDDDWIIGYCPEIPGANGLGRTIEECRQSLIDAINLILEDRRESALNGIPTNAIKEIIKLSWKDGRFFNIFDIMDVTWKGKVLTTHYG